MVSLDDLADRPPQPSTTARSATSAATCVRTIATPHVPHGWEAQVLFDETTGTLLCGDLFTRIGDGPALVHDADSSAPALEADDLFGATGLTPATAPDAAPRSPTSSRARSPSCTAPPSQATARRRCTTSPTPTRRASPRPRGCRHEPRRARPRRPVTMPVDATQVPPDRPPRVRDAGRDRDRPHGGRAALARTPSDWAVPTDCPAWDVRAMAGHVLGMTETFTGLRRMVDDHARRREARRRRAAHRRADRGPGRRANAHLDTAELLRRLETAGPVAGPLARPAPAAARDPRQPRRCPTAPTETWRMGYLLDVILTRDTWMHRVDIARATGRPIELTAEHDGRIVADVVAEWARRHGRPFTLHLTGPAGGTFVVRDATARSSPSTPSSSAASCPGGRPATACWPRRCHSDGHRAVRPSRPGASASSAASSGLVSRPPSSSRPATSR